MNWQEEFNIDISSLDREHEELAEGVDQLVATLEKGNPQRFLEHLDLLIEKVSKHFQREERMMLNIGLPDFERHKAEHTDLLAEVGKIREQLSTEFDATTPQAIENYLRYWLMRHISSQDIKIKDHLHRGLDPDDAD